MPHDQIDKALGTWIAGVPAACMAALGWIGFHLSKDDPKMNTKQFVGGVILASFTGGITCILLENTGLHPEIAAVIASAVGSSGIKGYEWLIQRAKNTEG